MAQLNPFERSLPGGFSDQGKAHLGFLDLPFDIRRIIYDLCLTTPEAIAIHLGRNRSHIANGEFLESERVLMKSCRVAEKNLNHSCQKAQQPELQHQVSSRL